ncbi:MAG TPA: hypothetical protein VFB43_17875 [Terracidiphilus sp.]|nr:hypothetical protein [Terracidiphilus sp.]
MKAAALVELLQANETLIALLAQATNVPDPKPPAVYQDVLPRGFQMPAIVVHRYTGVREQTFAGPVNAREDNFQIDVYGDTPADRDAVLDVTRDLLVGYAGTLPDETVVMGTYLEQDRDMPYLPNADAKSLAYRSLLGLRFVTKV